MKLLTLLLAVYMLLLPCIACADSNECNDTAATTVLKSAANHQSHQHEEEACNPFCNCVCCGHVIVSDIQATKILIENFRKINKQQSFYNSISLSSDFYGNIWQPPRVS